MSDLIGGFHTRTGAFDEWLDQRATMRAWEDFVTFRDLGRSQISGVRREILESWSRSIESGIDATSVLAPLDETEERLEAARQKNAELRAAAQQPFAKIGPLLSEANALLILTDAEGFVLEQIGDVRTHDAARGIHLVRGGNWDEAIIGTNGIGTAIRSGRRSISARASRTGPAPPHPSATPSTSGSSGRWTCPARPASFARTTSP